MKRCIGGVRLSRCARYEYTPSFEAFMLVVPRFQPSSFYLSSSLSLCSILAPMLPLSAFKAHFPSLPF